jgi:hypothetical protein
MTRLLVIGAVWPEPASSAAGAHILQVLRPFLSQGWDVTYASTALESDHAVDLLSLGISVERVKVNDSGFDTLLGSLQPEVVIFDRFFIEEQFAWRVEEHCPNALRVLNSEDLHCLRDARKSAQRQARDASGVLKEVQLKNDVARREVAAIFRSDLTLIISGHELEVLSNTFEVDRGLLHYCPFMIDPPTSLEAARMPTFEERQDFFWVGNFRHAPNWDAVQWLKQEVWPLVKRRLPEANLHIAGSYANQSQLAMNEPAQGFIVDGRIENSDTRFRESRICLAPLRFGAGLKGKLIDAMRNGTPSVTTGIGAEGISGDLPWAGAVQEDAASLAQSAVRLYENKSEWEVAQNNGFKILGHRFDRRQHEPLLTEQIGLALEQIHSRRERNFTGSMLRDHHHRSTRYLSLWIEAKNALAARAVRE